MDLKERHCGTHGQEGLTCDVWFYERQRLCVRYQQRHKHSEEEASEASRRRAFAHGGSGISFEPNW